MGTISAKKLDDALKNPDILVRFSTKHVSKHQRSDVEKRKAAAKRHKKAKHNR